MEEKKAETKKSTKATAKAATRQSTAKPTAKTTTKQSIAKPTAKTTTKQSTAKPTAKTTTKKSATKPTTKAVTKKSTANPTTKTTTKKSATKPTTKAASKVEAKTSTKTVEVKKTEEKKPEVKVKSKKRLSTIQIVIISVCAAIILAIFGALIYSNVNTISINKYIAEEIDFTGTNGYGSIGSSNSDIVDYETLMSDLGINKNFSSLLGGGLVLDEYIKVNLENDAEEKPTNLKNGDKVKYVITIDYKKINSSGSFKKRLKGKSKIVKTYKVEGLGDSIEINPFDAIEKVIVTKSYNSYNTKLQFKDDIKGYEITHDQYSSTGCKVKISDDTTISLNFKTPEIENINAGDKITITLSGNVDDYVGKGVLLTETSKEFEVVTTSELEKSSDISKQSYEKLRTIFEDSKKNQTNGEYTLQDLYFYRGQGEYTQKYVTRIYGVFKYKRDAVGSEDKYISSYIDTPMIESDGELDLTNVSVSNSYGDGYSSIKDLEDDYSKSENGTTVIAFDKLSE